MSDNPQATILNVTDNEATRYARSRILRRAGYVVKEAKTGKAALPIVEDEQPDIVLLDVQLPDSDGFEVCRPIKTDCEEVLARVLLVLRVQIEEMRAIVTHDGLPTVLADATQLGQLLQNLVSNVLKFHGEQPPQVHIAVKPTGKQWIFTVQDHGIGIAPQFAERIFAVFQRLHTHREFPGTGIGLAICKKIVERHDGRIWVESKPGKGSTFYFTLPA